jgi:hypothetical protein
VKQVEQIVRSCDAGISILLRARSRGRSDRSTRAGLFFCLLSRLLGCSSRSSRLGSAPLLLLTGCRFLGLNCFALKLTFARTLGVDFRLSCLAISATKHGQG